MAPEAFDKCVKAGNPVRRKTLPGGRYVNICILGPNKSVAGHIHEKKKKGK